MKQKLLKYWICILNQVKDIDCGKLDLQTTFKRYTMNQTSS